VFRIGFAFTLVAAVLSGGPAAAEQGLCPGTVFDINFDPPHHGYVPFIRLELEKQRGLFMIDTGATLSSANIDVFGEERYDGEPLRGFSFPNAAEGVFFRRQMLRGPNGEAMLGIVGLDLLGLHTIELHYNAVPPFLVIGPPSCPTERLSGFVPIDQSGFFSIIPEHSAPDIANVPIVFVRLGEVRAPAQLDSGYADVPAGLGPLQVNDAFLGRLRAAGVGSSVVGTIHKTDCRLEQREVENLSVEGQQLEITAESSASLLFSYADPVLQTKPRDDCGGIADFASRPFGLLGASYLKNWGTVVIDPGTEKVWLRPSAAVRNRG
jgi:hypothetical protein